MLCFCLVWGDFRGSEDTEVPKTSHGNLRFLHFSVGANPYLKSEKKTAFFMSCWGLNDDTLSFFFVVDKRIAHAV